MVRFWCISKKRKYHKTWKVIKGVETPPRPFIHGQVLF